MVRVVYAEALILAASAMVAALAAALAGVSVLHAAASVGLAASCVAGALLTRDPVARLSLVIIAALAIASLW